MWYLWTSKAAFDAWHFDVCNGMGLPRPGYNNETGEIDLDAQWTIAYTTVVQVADNDWRAVVESAEASKYPNGLGLPCDPPLFTVP